MSIEARPFRIKRTLHPKWAQTFWDDLAPLKDKIIGHPLFEQFANGRLSVECVQKALIHFYPLVEDFPKLMALNFAKTIPETQPGYKEAKYWLMENMDVEQKHSELWRLWAKGFGCIDSQLDNAQPSARMDAINHYLWHVNARASLIEGIAATNLAIEWPTGEWTKSAIKGMRLYKGRVPDVSKRTAQWLEAHSKYDDEHPFEAMELIKLCSISTVDQSLAFRAAQRGMEYYLVALDDCLNG